MPFTKLNSNMNIISALDDEPNDVGGLTAQQLKAKFDEAGISIKDYINNMLIPQLDALDLSSLFVKNENGIVTPIQEVLDEKVVKKPGMGLSRNDYSDAEKLMVSDNASLRHSHNNMAQLNSVVEFTKILGNATDKVPTEFAVASALQGSGMIPLGGVSGSYLRKRSNSNYDIEWAADVSTASGSYSGDNTSSRTISLAFTPLAVLVKIPAINGKFNLAVTGMPCESNAIEICTGGFIVRHIASIGFNASGENYSYIAWK